MLFLWFSKLLPKNKLPKSDNTHNDNQIKYKHIQIQDTAARNIICVHKTCPINPSIGKKSKLIYGNSVAIGSPNILNNEEKSHKTNNNNNNYNKTAKTPTQQKKETRKQ